MKKGRGKNFDEAGVSRLWFLASLLFLSVVVFTLFPHLFGAATTFSREGRTTDVLVKAEKEEVKKPVRAPLDESLYDVKMEMLANNPPPKEVPPAYDANGKVIPPPPPKPNLWPVKTVYPEGGAILPFYRVIAYYGNLYSTKMGVLGQYPEAEMLSRLKAEVKKWEAADPETPVMPALHYIAVVAQAGAGTDGKYRARMPGAEIDKVLAMAEKINGIVFLDIQAGLSNIQSELPVFEKYLKLPNVHLGIDPEFYMKTGARPGKVIGTLDASEINYAAEYLARLVKENDLPPKILVIHRFTKNMVTNSQNIKPLPEVQVVMHMDGWGGKAKKIGTYKHFIYPEPVQFTGFKLFYKNDVLEAGTTLFSPEELLKLNPKPIYIQYQ